MALKTYLPVFVVIIFMVEMIAYSRTLGALRSRLNYLRNQSSDSGIPKPDLHSLPFSKEGLVFPYVVRGEHGVFHDKELNRYVVLLRIIIIASIFTIISFGLLRTAISGPE